MSYYSRRSYSNSTIFSGYIVDTSPSKFTIWSATQNYRNVREFIGRKLRKRRIFSLQGKFYFFQSLNSKVIPNLSISSIKKVMIGSYPRQNDDVLVLWCQPKKKLAKSGIRTHANRAGLDLKSNALTTRPPIGDRYLQKTCINIETQSSIISFIINLIVLKHK